MLVPVVSSLAQQYPDLHITVLSRGFARPLFESLAPHVGFMEAELKSDNRGVHGLNVLYRRLKAKQFTAIADMHGVLRSWYLRQRFRLDRYRVASIDKHRQGKRRLAAKSGKEMVQQPTSFQNYAEVLSRLGYPVNLEFKSIFPPQGGKLRLLSPADLQEKKTFEKWIGVAPFAAHQGKVLEPEKTEQVVRMLLLKHPNARIFLFGGGRKEREVFAKWCADIPRCFAAADLLKGISEELILMSHLDLMVSMDSANQHLASLVGTPVVSVWGATHPYAGFLGWGQTDANVVQVSLPCRPCSIYGNKPCMRGDWACLRNITPEMVVERVEYVLDHR
jgi:ADP-heptose:LPS heptosyltransferase